MRIDEYRKRRRQDPKYIAVEKDLKPHFTLGNNILRLRMGADWSQSELAKRVGTKQTNISKVENGLSNPTYKFLIKLANVFNTSIEELVREGHSETRSEEPSERTITKEYYIKSGYVPYYTPVPENKLVPNAYRKVVVDTLSSLSQ